MNYYKNKYLYRSKLSEAKFRELVKVFSIDVDLIQLASMVNLNRNTVSRYVQKIRLIIADLCSEKVNGGLPFEANFKGIGRRDFLQVAEMQDDLIRISFAIFAIKGKIYTKFYLVSYNFAIESYKDIILKSNSAVSYIKDLTVNELCRFVRDESSCRKKSYVIGSIKERETISLFIYFLNSRLRKFFGISRSSAYLHIKESEFRFNRSSQEIYMILLRWFRGHRIIS